MDPIKIAKEQVETGKAKIIFDSSPEVASGVNGVYVGCYVFVAKDDMKAPNENHD